MIHFYKPTTENTFSFWNLNLFDKMSVVPPPTLANAFKVLVTVTSQQTGKSKTFLPFTSYSALIKHYPRYMLMFVLLMTDPDDEVLSLGYVYFGNTDYPLGFYDVIIYENTSNVNLDPTGLTVVWNGLMNLTSNDSATIPVGYKEYTTNDADTDSVYVTL